MTKAWADHKDLIISLYGKKSLAEVIKQVEAETGFKACTRAYKQKLKEWGARKYRKFDSAPRTVSDENAVLSPPPNDLDSTELERGRQPFSRPTKHRSDSPSPDPNRKLPRLGSHGPDYRRTPLKSSPGNSNVHERATSVDSSSSASSTCSSEDENPRSRGG